MSTLQVTMRESVFAAGGVAMLAGTVQTLQADEAAGLVQQNKATRYGTGWEEDPDSLTPAQIAAVGALVSKAGILGAAQRLNPNAMAVMAAPPTLTLTDESNVLWTGNTLRTSGRAYAVNNAASGADAWAGQPAGFSVFRASYPARLGNAYPNYLYAKYQTAEDAIGTYLNHSMMLSMVHTGSKLAVLFKGQSGTVLVKVNDQWASFTPTSIANDGALRVFIIDFGSSATRRVDVLGSNLAPRGIWVDATDTLEPAPQRGLRVCVLSDSFGQGAGNEVASNLSWITYMAEFLGWDDVYSIASAGAGLISTNGGTKKKLADRVARDVLPLSPDVVIVQPSTNDNSQTAAAVLAEAQSLYATLKAAGIKAVVFTSPSISSGAGAIVNNGSLRLHNAAIKAWCASIGIPFIDWIEQPLPSANAVPHVQTLTSSPAAGATTFTTAGLLLVGATYKFPDGTACYVKSVSGLTATVDNVQVAQSSGATITQCGPCVFTGTGRSGATTGWGNSDLCISTDGTHPLNLGHRLLGETAARQIAAL